MILRLSVIALFLSAAFAVAEPRVTENVRYYTVSGSSFSELRDQMALRGPNGFWGYTSWYIKWSSRCKVDLSIQIELPRLSRQTALSARDQRIWNAMIAALERHESGHAAHGRNAAREILTSRCQNPNATIRKWAARDRLFDRTTDHGRTEGVWLPE